ncbi:MAG: putative dsRNA-binding protein [Firmicutes bacterium]|nr:putative dsRNA-binding protein [Bacillota bacterium]
MNAKTIAEIEGIIDYEFSKKGLLVQAFTRRSYSEENPNNPCNEVLETLGDSVIQLYVTRALLERYKGEPVTEGGISVMRQRIVNGKNLAWHAERLGLAKKEYLRMGKGDISQKVYERQSVQEDLLESIVGAVAIDCDYHADDLSILVNHLLDIEHLDRTQYSIQIHYVMHARDSSVRGDNNNPINFLQELHKANKIQMPRYKDEGHCAEGWKCEASIPEMGLYLYGHGESKKEAKLNSAQKLYDEVVEKLKPKFFKRASLNRRGQLF